MRAVRAIEHSDVCILMIDATRGFETQDQRIFHIADRNKKGIVILVNKWDLIKKDTNSTKNFEEQIKRQPYNFPKLEILNKYSNIEDYTIADFKINNYEFHENINLLMRQ